MDFVSITTDEFAILSLDDWVILPLESTSETHYISADITSLGDLSTVLLRNRQLLFDTDTSTELIFDYYKNKYINTTYDINSNIAIALNKALYINSDINNTYDIDISLLRNRILTSDIESLTYNDYILNSNKYLSSEIINTSIFDTLYTKLRLLSFTSYGISDLETLIQKNINLNSDISSTANLYIQISKSCILSATIEASTSIEYVLNVVKLILNADIIDFTLYIGKIYDNSVYINIRPGSVTDTHWGEWSNIDINNTEIAEFNNLLSSGTIIYRGICDKNTYITTLKTVNYER